MNIVEVIGGTAKQKQYVESIAYYCIQKLMPRMASLDIVIRIKSVNDAYGYCLSVTDREFEIEVQRDMPLRKLLTTVAHEMVHVKQYARKELIDDTIWQGKTVNPKRTDYWELPWEIEAHGRETGLFIRWAEQNGHADKKWSQE